MALYTFYPCRDDGHSDTFVNFDLTDDAEAHVRAVVVLKEHSACSQVVVWCGDRKVVVRRRAERDPGRGDTGMPATSGPDQHLRS